MSLTPEPATRIYADPISDSSRWNAFTPRTGDIAVSTPPKSGTTWTQGILALLISGDTEVDADVSVKSPWIDIIHRDLAQVMEVLEAQDHRRHIKSHSPLDCIPYWNELRYITVYRHPIDVHFSMQKHLGNLKQEDGQAPPPKAPSESFAVFLEDDAGHASLSHILDHYRATLARRSRGNLIRLHYADMLADLEGAMAQIAEHVGISHPPRTMQALAEAATFKNMKANATRFVPASGQNFWRSDAGFFDSASSNKWEGLLTRKDLAAYDAKADAALTQNERQWLEWGATKFAAGSV